MAQTLRRLNALAVTRANKKGDYADGGGLYLQVSASGAKSWIYRYQLNGRERQMGLGPAHTISLADARRKAAECRKLKCEGTDPIEARNAVGAKAKLAAAKAMTFEEVATAYIESHRPGWRSEKHANQWKSTLAQHVYPVMGKIPVQSIDVTLVMKVLEPIWATKTETASRLRGRIEAVLDYAKARGHRIGENPARWRGLLENLLPKRSKVRQVKHFPALPYANIGQFMADLRLQNSVSARALEFLILTATRTSEVLGARWSEIDLEESAWTIPASRMKANKEFRVPLSKPAHTVLQRMSEVQLNKFVFPGVKRGRSLSNMTLLSLLQRMGRTDITTHGFRSTFRDWTAEQTAYPRDVAEMALAHTLENKVEAAYRRGDLFEKRRPLMEDWAQYCGTVRRDAKVVHLSREAQNDDETDMPAGRSYAKALT